MVLEGCLGPPVLPRYSLSAARSCLCVHSTGYWDAVSTLNCLKQSRAIHNIASMLNADTNHQICCAASQDQTQRGIITQSLSGPLRLGVGMRCILPDVRAHPISRSSSPISQGPSLHTTRPPPFHQLCRRQYTPSALMSTLPCANSTQKVVP